MATTTEVKAALSLAESQLNSAPVTTDGVFTYYDGPNPEQDDTSMLIGKNPHLIVKTEKVLDLRTLGKPLTELSHDEYGFRVLSSPDKPLMVPGVADERKEYFLQDHYRPQLYAFVKEQLGFRFCDLWGHLVRDTPREEHEAPRPKNCPFPTASGTKAFHIAHIDFSRAATRSFLRATGTPHYFEILNNKHVTAEERAEFLRLRAEIIAAEEVAMRKQGIDPAAEKDDGTGGHWDWDGTGYDGPRYGMGTIWQALDTVKRDPIAVSLSADKDVEWTSLKRRYDQRGHEQMGQFMFENMLCKAEPKQKWAYISEQTPQEVYFIKFCDSDVSNRGGSMKSMCSHTAFHLPGTEALPARASVDTKVLFIV